MKEILELLSAYPLWVKVSVAGLWALSVVLLIVFRPEVKAGDKPSVSISIGTSNSGIVAGRDVIVQGATQDMRVQELVHILDIRAARISNDLVPLYKYAVVRNYLNAFSVLHHRHIEALQRGNVVEAHELLIQIQQLSAKLESDEFWARHDKETPDTHYMLLADAFLRGPLITWYAGKALQQELIEEAMRDRYSEGKPSSHTGDRSGEFKAFYQRLLTSP